MPDYELNRVFQVGNLLSKFVHLGDEVFIQFHRVLLFQRTVQRTYALLLRGNAATTALGAAVFFIRNTAFVNLHFVLLPRVP